MAKNIDFMGAIFPDVPSVKLPQQGGGLVAFDDTTDATATADKILQGYTAYANGQKLTGTASGGITPSGTMSITSNGIYDVTQYASADVNVSGGGGASNVVTGTFRTGTVGEVVETADIPYSGSGYPIAGIIKVKGSISPELNNVIQERAVVAFDFTKVFGSTTPDYSGSGNSNSCILITYYKSSASDGQYYTYQAQGSLSLYKASGAMVSGSNTFNTIMFVDSNTISYAVGSGDRRKYGLLIDTEYEYYIVYSS